MIDFENEIQKYNFLEISSSNEYDLLNDYISTINKDLRRIGKEQSNLTMQIDDLHESIENLDEINNLKKEYKLEKKNLENEKSDTISNIIEILDNIENFIHYSKKNLDSSINDQLNIMWTQLGNTIRKIGINRIESNNKIFSNEFHVAKEVISIEEKSNNEILETLNSGYMMDKKIIRKSNVIVNKKGKTLNE